MKDHMHDIDKYLKRAIFNSHPDNAKKDTSQRWRRGEQVPADDSR